MSTDKQKKRSLALRCGAMVSLRWERIGTNLRRSRCGRLKAVRVVTGSTDWILYQRDKFAAVEYGRWKQVCAAAREILKCEARANNKLSNSDRS